MFDVDYSLTMQTLTRNLRITKVITLCKTEILWSYGGFDATGSGLGHVFKTSDGGDTWRDLSGNLPDKVT